MDIIGQNWTQDPGSRLASAIREEIWTRLLNRETPADIWRDFAGRARDVGAEAAVSQKTITRMAAKLSKDLEQPKDLSGPWRFTPGTASSVLLDAVAAVMTHTRGQVTTITQREAEWIEAIASTRPEIQPFELWRLARLYVAYEAPRDLRGEDGTAGDVDDLDALLAFAPWRGIEERERYEDACRSGWITAMPQFILQSLYTGQPQRAELPNPEVLVVKLRPYNKGLRAVKEAIAQGGRIRWPVGDHMHWTRSGTEHCEAEWRCKTEMEPKRTRAPMRRVSNPVSNKSRSATGRRRPKRSGTSARQDVADVDE